ncbi:smad nuclear-interacting protein 1 [Scomber japonicus]|uniref:smad nuclear-interacting protein 1 n=1 Tax=Scomber japonicus TaxID=13676 RepID=UPI002305B30C|nr:smad nuclear-interacting protein 1 [Scomber japonicus]
MTKEKRHRRRESPDRESKVKIKQEKVSPVRPQRSRRSRSRSPGYSSPPRQGTSRSPARMRDRSPDRRETSPARRSSRSPRNRRSRSPNRGAEVRIKREREEHRSSGDERRRRNDRPEERRSRWESDRPQETERGGERHRERGALGSQQAERRQHDERRRENRQRREENQEQDFGQSEEGSDTNEPPVEKEKPNFGLSGALTEDTNTFRGVVIKYNEPPEARIPKRRWRLYPFKNDEPLPVMYIHRQSAYLLGRQRKIADIPIDHPSCSKQHAVFQYRLMEFTRSDGTPGRRVKPYIIDLGSGNGTYLNNQRIDPQRYYELKEKDVLKFGFSSREYVLLHEFSDTSEVDAKLEEEDEGLDE